jgi:hypothetical protein
LTRQAIKYSSQHIHIKVVLGVIGLNKGDNFMKKIAVVLLGLLIATSAFADGLTSPVAAICQNASDCSVSGVNLTSSATAVVSTRSTPLHLLGAGLRKKKVAIVDVNVYVGQLYSDNASTFVRTGDGALASLDANKTVALTMTFLRDVSADQVQGAFQDALAANNVDQTSTEMAAFLNAVEAGGDAKNGKVITTIGEKLDDGTEVVTYVNDQAPAVSVVGPKGFVSAIMSIWLGTPSDTDLGKAKNDMMTDRKLTN